MKDITSIVIYVTTILLLTTGQSQNLPTLTSRNIEVFENNEPFTVLKELEFTGLSPDSVNFQILDPQQSNLFEIQNHIELIATRSLNHENSNHRSNELTLIGQNRFDMSNELRLLRININRVGGGLFGVSPRIDEVKIFSNGQNIANTATISVDSYIGGDGPEKTVDGSLRSYWEADISTGEPIGFIFPDYIGDWWIEFDFGNLTAIDSISIYADMTGDYTVEISKNVGAPLRIAEKSVYKSFSFSFFYVYPIENILTKEMPKLANDYNLDTLLFETLNINEIPHFDFDSYYIPVLESDLPGSEISAIDLAIQDPEGDSLFHDIAGDVNNRFRVTQEQLDGNKYNYYLTVDSLLDYEQQANHSFEIRRSDGYLFDSASVEVNIVDVNESPQFNYDTIQIPENSISGSVFTLNIFDPENDKFTSNFVDSNLGSDSLFELNDAHEMILKQTLDYEHNATYTQLKVEVNEVNTRPILNSEDLLAFDFYDLKGEHLNLYEIEVFSEGENIVKNALCDSCNTSKGFALDGKMETFWQLKNENTSLQNPISLLLTLDTLSKIDSIIVNLDSIGGSYSIGNTHSSFNNEIFSLKRNASLRSVSKYERQNTIDSVVIEILDVNEAPQLQPATISIEENYHPDSIIYIPSVWDPEGDTLILYALDNSEDLPIIFDHTNRLMLKTGRNFDFETKNTYQFNVVASDGVFFDTAAFRIDVTDANDPPSQILFNGLDKLDTSVYDIIEEGQLSISLSTIDQDDSIFTYEIIDQSVDAEFQIIGDTSLINLAVIDKYNKALNYVISSSDGEHSVTDTFIINFMLPLSINQLIPKIYPNPVNKVLMLNNASQIREISVLSLDGSLIDVYDNRHGEHSIALSFTGYAKGIYMLKLVDVHFNARSIKILKQD
ncbi:MAG: T9SS type A sorting domain-containing protein [Cyclobacteriaceae bacterium]